MMIIMIMDDDDDNNDNGIMIMMREQVIKGVKVCFNLRWEFLLFLTHVIPSNVHSLDLPSYVWSFISSK